MWIPCIIARGRVRKHQRRGEILLLRALLSHVRLHDADTFIHARNVARLAHAVARRLLPPRAAREVTLAALLHDVGKVFLGPDLIRKAAPLTPAEWLRVEGHAAAGACLLRTCPSLGRVARLVRHHHERWDGCGYPDGLRGRRIPLGARLIALADSFDAITSHRPYAPARSGTEAEAELRANAGTQFDPRLVEVFLATLRDEAVPTPAVAGGGGFPARLGGQTALPCLRRGPAGAPRVLRLAASLAGATGITAAAVSLALAARGPAPAPPAQPSTATVSAFPPTVARPSASPGGRRVSIPSGRPGLLPSDPQAVAGAALPTAGATRSGVGGGAPSADAGGPVDETASPLLSGEAASPTTDVQPDLTVPVTPPLPQAPRVPEVPQVPQGPGGPEGPPLPPAPEVPPVPPTDSGGLSSPLPPAPTAPPAVPLP